MQKTRSCHQIKEQFLWFLKFESYLIAIFRQSTSIIAHVNDEKLMQKEDWKEIRLRRETKLNL